MTQRRKELSHLLVHYPTPQISKQPGKGQDETRSHICIRVSHMSGNNPSTSAITHCPPSSIIRELGQKWSGQNLNHQHSKWDSGVTSGNLIYWATTLAHSYIQFFYYKIFLNYFLWLHFPIFNIQYFHYHLSFNNFNVSLTFIYIVYIAKCIKMLTVTWTSLNPWRVHQWIDHLHLFIFVSFCLSLCVCVSFL